MTKKSLIFGATDLAQLLQANLLETGNRSVEAFVVDDGYTGIDTLMGLPVVSSKQIDSLFSPPTHAFYIAVGYSSMNGNRKRVFQKLQSKKYQILNFIHPDATVKTIKMGLGNLFFPNAFMDFFTEIGDGNIFYPGACFSHHSIAGNFNFFAVNCCVAGHVKMGDRNFVGANSTVINNISLGDQCLIGAGASLTEDLKNGQVFVPAKGKVLENHEGRDFL